MVTQQINFLPRLVEDKSTGFFLDVSQLSILYGVFLAVLLVILFMHVWQRHEVSRQLKTVSADIVVTQKSIAKLLAEYPELDTGDAATAMRAGREKQRALMAALMPGPAFADIMRSLSVAINPGVWLTRITVADQGTQIDLYGKAIYETAIKEFLARLGKQKVFSGKHFQLTELTKPGAGQAESFTFRIATGTKNQ